MGYYSCSNDCTMYEQAWQCLECGREYQNEPARCQCGRGDLKEIRREVDDGNEE